MKKRCLFLSAFAVLFTILFQLTVYPVAAACSDPAGPGVDWSGCDKSGINVGSLDLSGAILVGTNLAGAYFGNANLTGADLTNAIVTNMNVFQTNFTNATLLGATGTPRNYGWATYDHTICPSGILSNYTPNNMCYDLTTAVHLRSVAAQPEHGSLMPIAAVVPLLLLSTSVWAIRRSRKRHCP